MESPVIGVDIGGSVMRVGMFTPSGKILAKNQQLVEAHQGWRVGLRRLAGLIRQTWEEIGSPRFSGIGIGCTGPVDSMRGLIQNPYTLPTWENVPIVQFLQDEFGVPVTLENDADAAALGEYWMGAGQGAQRLYAITVGTGIGTACILDGRIYRGIGGAHPDGGHHIIEASGPPCYCGANGCWESLASGAAIERVARARIAAETDSLIWGMIAGNVERLETRIIADAAFKGDSLACEIIQDAARYFSFGLINVITLFVPEVIVLSGGVMNSLPLFMPAIEKAVRDHNVMVPAKQVRILPAQLGEYAGLYGAAYSILQRIENM